MSTSEVLLTFYKVSPKDAGLQILKDYLLHFTAISLPAQEKVLLELVNYSERTRRPNRDPVFVVALDKNSDSKIDCKKTNTSIYSVFTT